MISALERQSSSLLIHLETAGGRPSAMQSLLFRLTYSGGIGGINQLLRRWLIVGQTQVTCNLFHLRSIIRSSVADRYHNHRPEIYTLIVAVRTTTSVYKHDLRFVDHPYRWRLFSVSTKTTNASPPPLAKPLGGPADRGAFR